MNKKYIWLYLIIIPMIGMSLLGGAYYYVWSHNKPVVTVDKYGYTHTKYEPGSTTQLTDALFSDDEMAEVKPAYVIDVPSDVEGTFFSAIEGTSSAYEFLTYALPYVEGGKEYTIFKFADGTGLYITKSNQSSAIYGEVGEINNEPCITQDIGYITITGMNMNYRDIPDYASKESRSLAELIPVEFQTDGLYVRVNDEYAYICIATDGKAKEAADLVYEAVKNELDGLPLVILVNDSYKYEY